MTNEKSEKLKYLIMLISDTCDVISNLIVEEEKEDIHVAYDAIRIGLHFFSGCMCDYEENEGK